MIVPYARQQIFANASLRRARSGTCRRSSNAGCPGSGQRWWIARSMRNCSRPFSAVSLEASTPSACSDLAVCSSPTLQATLLFRPRIWSAAPERLSRQCSLSQCSRYRQRVHGRAPGSPRRPVPPLSLPYHHELHQRTVRKVSIQQRRSATPRK
jgi:hypothetical protein